MKQDGYSNKEEEIGLTKALLSLAWWTIVLIVFGYVMYSFVL